MQNRDAAELLRDIAEKIATYLDPGEREYDEEHNTDLPVDIVGSFRRRRPTVGDIDVLNTWSLDDLLAFFEN